MHAQDVAVTFLQFMPPYVAASNNYLVVVIADSRICAASTAAIGRWKMTPTTIKIQEVAVSVQ